MRTLLWSYLGWHRFPRELSLFEVRQFFSLARSDRQALRRRFRSRARLGAALQLGFVRMAGTTLEAFDHLPREVLAHVAAVVPRGAGTRNPASAVSPPVDVVRAPVMGLRLHRLALARSCDQALTDDGEVGPKPSLAHVAHNVHTPGIYVDRLVKGGRYERRIEKLTTRPRPQQE
jgi:hypothetical protein